MLTCYCDMETFNPYIEREYRARKEHRCEDCGGAIQPGERYTLIGGKFDGEWSMYKRCADCQHMIHEVGRSLLEECGGWSCVYCGDLAASWRDLLDYDYHGTAAADDAAEVRRIVAMQHAICEARHGTIQWDMPRWATHMNCPECGNDVRRPGGVCVDCGAECWEGES